MPNYIDPFQHNYRVSSDPTLNLNVDPTKVIDYNSPWLPQNYSPASVAENAIDQFIVGVNQMMGWNLPSFTSILHQAQAWFSGIDFSSGPNLPNLIAAGPVMALDNMDGTATAVSGVIDQNDDGTAQLGDALDSNSQATFKDNEDGTATVLPYWEYVLDSLGMEGVVDLVDWLQQLSYDVSQGITKGNWTALMQLLFGSPIATGVIQIGALPMEIPQSNIDGLVADGLFWTAAYDELQNFLITGDWNDLTSAWQDLVQAIFGRSDQTGLTAQIPATSIFDSATSSVQPVADFPNAQSMKEGDGWEWDGTVDHTGKPGSGSAKATASGLELMLVGILYPVQSGQTITPTAWLKWTGLASVAGSSPLQLLIVPDVGSPVMVAKITNPASSASWTKITGTWSVPSGTSYVQLGLVVTGDASAGTVWWDDCTLAVSGGYLANINSGLSALQSEANASANAFATLLNSWSTTITTGGQSWSAMWDSLESAWATYVQTNQAIGNQEWATLTQLVQGIFGINPSTGQMQSSQIDGWTQQWNEFSAAITGDPADAGDWAWLGQFMNALGVKADSAHSMSVDNTNTLAIRNNKPLIYGLDDTTESNIAFSPSMSGSGSLSPTSAGASHWAFVRCGHADTKNTVAFIASLQPGSGSGALTVSVAKVDFANSQLVYVYTSPDVSAQLTTAKSWIFTSANAVTVEPGDVLAIHFYCTGSLDFQLYGVNATSVVPAHPTAQLPALAATGTHAPGGTVAFSALAFSNSFVPYIGLETSSPPPPSYPDNPHTFTGSTSYRIASYLGAGDLVDLVGVGAGGGGQGETGANVGRGGSPGSWNAKTLVVGTDIAAGGTITITVPAGGAGGPYFNDGTSGSATVFSWRNAAGTAQTLNCAGGHGGGILNPANLTQFGPGPGNYTWNSQPYYGGTDQLIPNVGNVPGGAGAGGGAFQYGWAGARGQAWIVERQG